MKKLNNGLTYILILSGIILLTGLIYTFLLKDTSKEENNNPADGKNANVISEMLLLAEDSGNFLLQLSKEKFQKKDYYKMTLIFNDEVYSYLMGDDLNFNKNYFEEPANQGKMEKITSDENHNYYLLAIPNVKAETDEMLTFSLNKTTKEFKALGHLSMITRSKYQDENNNNIPNYEVKDGAVFFYDDKCITSRDEDKRENLDYMKYTFAAGETKIEKVSETTVKKVSGPSCLIEMVG